MSTRGCETKDLPEREVPGHDRQHGTHRLVADEGVLRARFDVFVAEKRRRVLGVIAAIVERISRPPRSLLSRVPHLRRQQPAESFWRVRGDRRNDACERAFVETSLTIDAKRTHDAERRLDSGIIERFKGPYCFPGCGLIVAMAIVENLCYSRPPVRICRTNTSCKESP